MAGGENGPPILNGGSNDYDRDICFDSPVEMDTGLYSEVGNHKTLTQLREELMVRLGFAAQLANPPPGMAALLNSFLQDAQEQLYFRYDTLRTERWFTWQTSIGSRFYDVPIDCLESLNFRKITGAYLQDGETWYPLQAGIDPLLFNITANGLPTNYELRKYVEIFPAPDSADYLIRLKGHIGLLKFTDNDDRTTIDSRPVFLMALANAKAHYGQPDAGNYIGQLETLIRGLVAGAHGTKRYILGDDEYPRPWPRPRPGPMP